MNKETKIGEIVLILKEFGVNRSIDELYLVAKEIVKSIDHPTEKGGAEE
jgi:hypothetical protein